MFTRKSTRATSRTAKPVSRQPLAPRRNKRGVATLIGSGVAEFTVTAIASIGLEDVVVSAETDHQTQWPSVSVRRMPSSSKRNLSRLRTVARRLRSAISGDGSGRPVRSNIGAIPRDLPIVVAMSLTQVGSGAATLY